MRPLWIALTALFIACIPVFLVASNVRWVINAPFLYSYGFDRYGVSETTGIERDELIRAGAEFRDYFNNDEELLEVRVVQHGVLRSIYNEREVAHMRDVKHLVQGVWNVHAATGGYIGFFLLLGALVHRRKWLAAAGELAGWGGLVTLGGVAILGLAALVGFDRLFLAFHLISFSNDLWQLDPRRDVLIMMFPQGFFFDATMWIAGSTILEALLLASYLLARRIQGRRSAAGTAAEAEAGGSGT